MSTPEDGPARQAPAARQVILARHHPAASGEPDPTVHLIPLPLTGQEYQPNVSAFCELRLQAGEIEPVSPGEGTWCTLCFVAHVTGHPATPSHDSVSGIGAAAEREAAGMAYRTLGWPVVLRRDQITLNLDRDLDAVALVIPALLATEVVDVLTRRRCPPPVLAHPALPTHRIFLVGERFGVLLGWPVGVHRVTGTLLLPPTVTAQGPVSWVRPPQPHALRCCREIDVAAALCTALSGPPAAPPPARRRYG